VGTLAKISTKKNFIDAKYDLFQLLILTDALKTIHHKVFFLVAMAKWQVAVGEFVTM